jgi:hypothetical protein
VADPDLARASASRRAISWGIEPGMRVATARQSAPVSGVARCACPFDIMRTAISMSPAASLRPDSTLIATGGATKATIGTLRLPAFSMSGAIPIATEAARRMASSLAISCEFPSISVGGSVAVAPIASDRHEHARIGGIDHAHRHAAHARYLQDVGGLAGGKQLAGLGAAGLHELEPDGRSGARHAVERHVARHGGFIPIHAENARR